MKRIYLFYITILIGGVVAFRQSVETKILHLKVGFPSISAVSAYDPAVIQMAYEYVLLENIFSTLVEIDVNGNVVPGLAESFEWIDDELHL